MSTVVKKTITEVKIAKGRTLQIALKEHLDDGTYRDVTLKCDQLYHNDMEDALLKLKPFLADICDLYEKESLSSMDDYLNDSLCKLEVSGVKISGSEDNEAATILGSKVIWDKTLNLISPMAEFNEYEKGEKLAIVVENIRYEAQEYLGGKYAIKQMELPFPDEKTEGEVDQEAAEIATTVLSNLADKIVGPKGKKGKKAQMSIVADMEVAEAM